MKLKRMSAYGVVGVVLLLLGGCGKKAPAPEIRPVRTLLVSATPIGDQVTYTGEIRSRYESDLAFRVGGKLIARPVDVGAQVAAGALLGQLDPGDQRLAVESAQSAVAAAQAEFDRAQSEEARYRDLLERGLTARSTYVTQQTATKTTQSRLQQARADLALRRSQSGYTALRADSAGVVTRVWVEVGTVVAAGQPVVTVAKPSELEVVFDVAESQVDAVRSAPSLEVALLSTRDKPFVGKVREVSPSADPVTRTYRVKLALPRPPPGLRLGMNTIVTLRTTASQPGLAIPATALYEKDRKPAVWVVKKDLKLELRSITVLSFETDTVTVSGGLAKGDRIVTAGVHKLLEGQEVRLLPEPVP